MRRIYISLAIIALLAGCQGQPRYGGGLHGDEGRKKTETKTGKNIENKAERPAYSSTYAADPIAMGKVIDKYLGRPYKGTLEGKKGYDCSEFVGEVYNEYASVHLPRTTENLFKTGRLVKGGDLYFGDLVFFDTGGRGVSHVGIYIGFGEFVHASSSNGIIISSMSDKYYKKRFLGARRVLE